MISWTKWNKLVTTIALICKYSSPSSDFSRRMSGCLSLYLQYLSMLWFWRVSGGFYQGNRSFDHPPSATINMPVQWKRIHLQSRARVFIPQPSTVLFTHIGYRFGHMYRETQPKNLLVRASSSHSQPQTYLANTTSLSSTFHHPRSYRNHIKFYSWTYTDLP
jgi:hypothetical protein